MIKDIWDSLKDNIKERTTNPFLGTFALVWTVKNWPIVYAFFFFDKTWNLQKRIEFFQEYWHRSHFIIDLGVVAILTILILIITYSFLGVSRLISSYFENVILPNIHKISKGKTVTIEVHNSTLAKLVSLENRMEEERKQKMDLQAQRDELESRLKSLNSSAIETHVNEIFSHIIPEANRLFKNTEIESTLLEIAKNRPFLKENNVIDFLLKFGLIELGRTSTASSGVRFYYKLTPEGENFKSEYIKANAIN